jgi:hypothetical protein
LSILKGMNDPMGIYARLPFNWRIEWAILLQRP